MFLINLPLIHIIQIRITHNILVEQGHDNYFYLQMLDPLIILKY